MYFGTRSVAADSHPVNAVPREQARTSTQRWRVTGLVIRIKPPDTNQIAAREIEEGVDSQTPMREHEHDHRRLFHDGDVSTGFHDTVGSARHRSRLQRFHVQPSLHCPQFSDSRAQSTHRFTFQQPALSGRCKFHFEAPRRGQCARNLTQKSTLGWVGCKDSRIDLQIRLDNCQIVD